MWRGKVALAVRFASLIYKGLHDSMRVQIRLANGQTSPISRERHPLRRSLPFFLCRPDRSTVGRSIINFFNNFRRLREGVIQHVTVFSWSCAEGGKLELIFVGSVFYCFGFRWGLPLRAAVGMPL